MTNDELRTIEKRWQNLRAEAVGGIAKQACTDVQAVIDELRRRDKAHRQAADAEAAITGALLGEPTSRLKVEPLFAEQNVRLHIEGRHYTLAGDMDIAQAALESYDGPIPLTFCRGDETGIIILPDELDYGVRNALWDYLVANLPNSIALSGWHNASYMTMGGQFKEASE